jgi:hypothetical protein
LSEELGALEDTRPASPFLPAWLAPLLQGITVLSLFAFAFWLGALSNKIEVANAKVDTLNKAVLESRDGLMPHVSAIEARLDAIDKKLSEQGTKK